MTKTTKNKSPVLSEERIAEILAFKNTNFTDCPIQTPEQLAKFKPRLQRVNPELFNELFKPKKKAVQIRLDADVLAWFKSFGKGYQSKINSILREVMMQNT